MLLQARSFSFTLDTLQNSTLYYHSPVSGFCSCKSRPRIHIGSSGVAAAALLHQCTSSRLNKQRKTRSAPAAAIMGEAHETSLPGLLATCVLMFVGAYGCGMLPAWLPVAGRRLASVNAIGAGLLLGSALAIILPEGFEAAMEAREDSTLPEWTMSLALLAGFWCMLLLDTLSHLLPAAEDNPRSSNDKAMRQLHSDRRPTGGEMTADAESANDEENVILLSDVQLGGTNTSSHPGTPKATQRTTTINSEKGNTSQTLAGSPAKKGAACTGGSLRHVASAAARGEQDAAAQSAAGSSSSSGQLQRPGSSMPANAAAAVDTVGASEVHPSAAARGFSGSAGKVLAGWVREPAQQALLGLVVHAASDGLAVGAASLAKEPAVSLSVAVAMIVHKGPVAVGLSTYLTSAKWPAHRVHKGVLVFSAASPVAALLTYFALSSLPYISAADNLPLAVLFSGGTVLYAATMHILPNALERHTHHNHHSSSQSAAGNGGPALKSMRSGGGSKAAVQQTVQSGWQLLLVSVGLSLPLVLSVLFHHEHSH